MTSPLQSVGDFLGGVRADLQEQGVSYRAQREMRREQALRALDTSRIKAMAEDARVVRGLLDAGASDVADRFLSDRISAIRELKGDPSDSMEIQELIRSEQIDAARAEVDAFVKGAQSGNVLDRANVQSSRILDDGTVVMALDNQSSKVIRPNGTEATGRDAAEQIKSAQEFGIDVQQRRSEARSAGSATGKGNIERLQNIVNEGAQNAQGITVIKRSLELLESVKTGGIDQAIMRAKELFGIEGANEAELSANLGKVVLSKLRANFGAQFTAAKGARLERIEAGFGKSVDGNRRLLQQTLRLAEREANRAIDAAIKLKDYHTAADIQELLDFELDDEGLRGRFAPSKIGENGTIDLSTLSDEELEAAIAAEKAKQQ